MIYVITSYLLAFLLPDAKPSKYIIQDISAADLSGDAS